MSREAEQWAWDQTWCDGTDKLILVAMCRLARVATYSGGTHQIARLAGVTPQTVKRAIRKFREVSLVTSPKRGTWIFDTENEVSPVTPQIEDPKRKDSPSPITPSISKENFSVLPRTYEGNSEWIEVIKQTATFCGGQPLTEQQTSTIQEKYGQIDLLDQALAFESYHIEAHRKSKYRTFATYARFSTTWLSRALEQSKNGQSETHVRRNSRGKILRPLVKPGDPSPLL